MTLILQDSSPKHIRKHADYIFFNKSSCTYAKTQNSIDNIHACTRRFNLKDAILLILVTEVGKKFQEQMVGGTNELK